MTIPSTETFRSDATTARAPFQGQILSGTTHSYTNTDATAIDFGVAVARGTTDQSCQPFDTYAQEIIGISVRSVQVEASVDGNNTVNFPRYSTVPVMRDGEVACKAAENVTAGDDVYAITSDAAALGGSTGGGSNGSSRKAIKGARWDQTVASGGVGRVILSGVGNINLTT